MGITLGPGTTAGQGRPDGPGSAAARRWILGGDVVSVDMTPAQLLTDAFERIRDGGRSVVHGLSLDELTRRPDPGANSIAWLVWHLTRIQDDHVADVAG